MNKKYKKQLEKEAIITVVLYVIYFAWWYYFAYIYAPENVEDYSYVLGMPAWFFYSCVLGLIFINILVYLAVKIFFKDIDLDAFDVDKNENKKEIDTDE